MLRTSLRIAIGHDDPNRGYLFLSSNAQDFSEDLQVMLVGVAMRHS